MDNRSVLTKKQIFEALDEALDLLGHTDFYVMGSSSLIVSLGDDLSEMLRRTEDVDIVSTRDLIDISTGKEEWSEMRKLCARFGPHSQFDVDNNFYVSMVDRVFFLGGPEGWQQRCMNQALPSGGIIKILDPHDCACFKLVAARGKDIEWLIETVISKVINVAELTERLKLCDRERIKVKETEIKTAWREVHEALSQRGMACFESVYPD